MGAGSVDGFEKEEARVGHSAGNLAARRIDGVRQLFVKISGLQDAERLEVMLDQNVVVVGFRGLQVGISNGDAGTAGSVGVDESRRHEIADVGSRNALAIVAADIGVGSKEILQLDAGKDFKVVGTLGNWYDRWKQRISHFVV